MTPSLSDVDDIETRIADASGVLAVAHARLVALAAEVIERELWRGSGFRSPAHWLTLKAGLSHARAQQVVDVATRASELPATVAALGAGELTFEQAHAVATNAPADFDAKASALAKVSTVSQLRSTLSRCRPVDPPEAADVGGDDADGAGAPETAASGRPDAPGRVTMGVGGGRFFLRVDAPAHQGALIEAALAEARDRLFQSGQPQVTWLDAILDLCAQSANATTPARRDRFRAYLHLDVNGAWLNGGPAVPQSIARGLICDGQLVPLWESDGVPISAGRAHRVAPPHTRRVVADRDRGCRFPGCGATTFLEQHHIVHWADGGVTDPSNLLSLCPFHHDEHHRGEYAISGDANLPDGVSFADRTGRAITAGAPRPPDRPPPSNLDGRRYRPPTGERFQTSLVSLAG
jgi:hypothetical protein